MNDRVRITFLGDVTCDRPLLNAGYIKNENRYDFSNVFSEVKDIFANSNYVVGNFETVCAGEKKGYNSEYLLYNTPDEFVEYMSKANINCVTTANNHCLDQGIKGISRTIDILDKNNVLHTGTYKNEDDYNDILYLDILGKKIAIISATYSTNESNTGVVLKWKNKFYVDLLRKQTELTSTGIKGKIKFLILKCLSAKFKRKLKRYIGRKRIKKGGLLIPVVFDTISDGDLDNKYLKELDKKISIAKSKSDIVVFCPHIGGQFNTEPGEYVKFLGDYLINKGCDYVIGNHPHVTQNTKFLGEKLIAYSLGSFNQSISADYMCSSSMPEYSVALNFYLTTVDNKLVVDEITFMILKIVEDSKNMITVYPINKIFEISDENEKNKIIKDTVTIYNRFTNKSLKHIEIKKEYKL